VTVKSLDWRSLHSMGEIPEFEKLEEWAKASHEGGGTSALEVGSYHGKSTVIMAQFFNPVYAIDLWGNVEQGLRGYQDIGQHHFEPFIKNIISLNLIDHVFPIVSSSSILELLPPLNIDFVYIDASHMYEDVKKDLLFVRRHLSNIGCIACDDYKRPGWGYPPYNPGNPHHGPNDPWKGVAKAIDEFLATNDFKIIEHHLGKVLIGKVQ
jgi:predicted O-methyltransferase YrrM